MPSTTTSPVRRVTVVAEPRVRGGVSVRLPFDPADAWGELEAYHVNGMLGGEPYRAALVPGPDGWRIELGPSWCLAPGFEPGDEVELVIGPEGPRSTTLGEDVAVAFEAEPAAARFFDSMPSFYRNNAARSLESAKRPETRARRIAEIVELAKQRKRER
jgi:Bacteriocin-protection, YdeI or OmpD-Associated/Domain of unknown function (DUF1905)